jgi:hypothetical protein
MLLTRFLVAAALVSGVCHGAEIPKVWDDHAVAAYRIPLAGLGHAPKMVSAREYYALP